MSRARSYCLLDWAKASAGLRLKLDARATIEDKLAWLDEAGATGDDVA